MRAFLRRYLPADRRVILTSLFAIILVISADQWAKSWAVVALDDYLPHPVIGSILQFHLVHNSGAAFGLGNNFTVVLTILAMLIVCALLVALSRVANQLWAITFGLAIGGALGNLIDRFSNPPGIGQGEVVDFLQLPNWPVFNIADMAVVTAACLLVVLNWKGVPIFRERASSQAESTASIGTSQ